MSEKILHKFARWFASPAGVWQTAIVVIGWVIIEQLFPRLDPNGFILLYVLTVYSGITQNILAYASEMSTTEATRTQGLIAAQNEKIEQLVLVNVHQNEAMIEMMRVIVDMQRQLGDDIHDIEEYMEGEHEA